MLYVSTRNADDIHTAHRAIHEERAPDGGFYIPFRLPCYAKEQILSFGAKTQGEIIATVLNDLFGTHFSGWDVECSAGRTPLSVKSITQKVLLAECWRNPLSSFDYLLAALYSLLTGSERSAVKPKGWARIAIEISVLFATLSALDISEAGTDLAISTGDYADVTSALLAKKMGFPLNNLICACDSNSGAWDLINKGELSTGAGSIYREKAMSDYLELLIHQTVGAEAASAYLDARGRRASYRMGQESLQILNCGVFAFVVSEDRAATVANGLLRTNGYAVDTNTAMAYAALQDYRARTGLNKETMIPMLLNPQSSKE